MAGLNLTPKLVWAQSQAYASAIPSPLRSSVSVYGRRRLLVVFISQYPAADGDVSSIRWGSQEFTMVAQTYQYSTGGRFQCWVLTDPNEGQGPIDWTETLSGYGYGHFSVTVALFTNVDQVTPYRTPPATAFSVSTNQQVTVPCQPLDLVISCLAVYGQTIGADGAEQVTLNTLQEGSRIVMRLSSKLSDSTSETLSTAVSGGTPGMIGLAIKGHSYASQQLSISPGVTRISAGKQKGDIGVILFGDSNMVGSGAGAMPNRDDIRPAVYQLSRIAPTEGQIIPSDLNWSSYLEFTTSAIFDGPGPGYFFLKELIKLGQSQGRRIVGLPCARWGSGFYWGDWPIGGPRYVVMQELVNTFLALNPDNRILCAAGTIGVNDRSVQTPAEIYDDIEIFINSIRSTAFTGNAAQPSFTNLPIIWLGGSTEYAASSPAFQAVLDMFATLEANFSNLEYVTFDGLTAEASDNIHLSGFSNRVVGQRMVQALQNLGGLPL